MCTPRGGQRTIFILRHLGGTPHDCKHPRMKYTDQSNFLLKEPPYSHFSVNKIRHSRTLYPYSKPGHSRQYRSGSWSFPHLAMTLATRAWRRGWTCKPLELSPTKTKIKFGVDSFSQLSHDRFRRWPALACAGHNRSRNRLT